MIMALGDANYQQFVDKFLEQILLISFHATEAILGRRLGSFSDFTTLRK